MNILQGPAPSKYAARPLRLGTFAFALALFAIAPHVALSAGSIFDDDWKAPPPSAKPPAPAYVPPPEPEAPPRLPPARPATPDSPVPTPDTPAVKPATPDAPISPALRDRAKVPADAAIAPAEKLVKDVYKAEYSRATTPAGQIALARALFNEAQQSRDDPVTLYVLLRDARNMAAAGGDAETAVEAARGIRDAFQINHVAAGEMERDALMSAVKAILAAPPTPTASPEPRSAVYLTMSMAERDLNAGNYAQAAQTAGQAEQVAKKVNDPSLLDRVHGRAAVLATAATEFQRSRDQFTALNASPDDPAANLAVGRFYAFVLDRPKQAMPLLAKGADTTLKGLAEHEIAAPPTPADQLALGDAWASAARINTGPAKEAMQRRALYWYDTAAPMLPGLSRMTAQKKASDLRANTLKHGLFGEYFRGRDFGFKVFARVDPRIEFNWRGLPPDDGMPAIEFSTRWTGCIKGGTPGEYKLVVIHDDGARIWIDGELVMDKGGDAGHDIQPVHLTGGFQELKIEYAQFGGESRMGLGWIPPRATKAVAISSDALFHAPLPAGPLVAGRPAPDGEGKILLPAGAAELHNARRAQLVQNKDSMDHIGAWDSTSTWLSWDFDAPEGDYDVDLEYACDGGNAGSDCAVFVAGNRMTMRAVDSGGWSSFTTTRLGRVRLAAGGQRLRLKGTNDAHEYLMDVGRIILTPAK
jgi:hypothetical protein